MREQLTGRLAALQRTFASFTAGQKTVAVIGAVAIVFAGVLVFRWAATPSYAPLFTNVAGADASAIVEELEAAGTPYQLADGGATILVPRAEVYDARIRLSGEGLPGEGSTGYAILDQQDLSTSQFQEQTGYKRAMEGELQKTIEALDAVDTAVVHLALPQQELFAEEEEATTASVLVETRAGSTLGPEQVQAVVHLVASSVEGLDPEQVTVADSTGTVLSASGNSFDRVADTRSQQVKAFEERVGGSVQGMLDKVLGAGNTAVTVTADLNFDKTVTNTKRYFSDPDSVPLSDTTLTETYTAPGTPGVGGVVGPDGALDPTRGNNRAGDATNYRKEQRTSDNAVGETVEQREAAPGSVESLHVGIVVDEEAAGNVTPAEIESLVSSGLGIDAGRGDTVMVSAMPFDRTAEEAAAKALEAAKAAEDREALMDLLKTAALLLVVLALFAGAWMRSRKRARAREDATSYVVEQIRRRDAIEQTQVVPIAGQQPMLELDPAVIDQANLRAAARDEIAAMVERQPEEVAQLLRGWLVDSKG
ncbi:MAG TPA: flagellar basal-body MS-ring/collar protein FliF [Nocardioidaceae bacterium]|nr:flagellar basal-body MS-ring/collar protein FliF [Nocardioidaceae bacterium]